MPPVLSGARSRRSESHHVYDFMRSGETAAQVLIINSSTVY
jgi:hypothetical protein